MVPKRLNQPLATLSVSRFVFAPQSLKKNDPARMRGIGESALALLDEFYSEGKMDRFEGLSSDPRVSRVGVVPALPSAQRYCSELVQDEL